MKLTTLLAQNSTTLSNEFNQRQAANGRGFPKELTETETVGDVVAPKQTLLILECNA